MDKVHPHLPKTEKAAIWWFVICKFPVFFSATRNRVLESAKTPPPRRLFFLLRNVPFVLMTGY